MSGRALVACIGNPDRGDDGVGPLVAEQLERAAPEGLVVRRYTDGLLGLLDDWRGFPRVICVDAVAPLGAPGQVHVIDPARESLPQLAPATSTHGVGLAEVIRLGHALGTLPPYLVIYGIEADCFDHGAAMTPAIRAAAFRVAGMILANWALELTPRAG